MTKVKYNKELKQYFKEMKSLLPIYGQREKLFLTDLKFDIDEFLESSPAPTHGQILSRFGEPKKIVANYLMNTEADYSKRISVVRWVKITAVSIIIIALISLGIFATYIFNVYQDSKEAHVEYIETVITEGE